MGKVKKIKIKIPLKVWNDFCKDFAREEKITSQKQDVSMKQIEEDVVKRLQNSVLAFMNNRSNNLKREHAYVT